ncbi:diketogulonate reductase-like aldo/keto reductase [Actinoalloteichus hoggarensis]|uniref:2,5-diketo-D-gluconic acid reductase B n=1 Tax=Actinoalloteichus hoggarensis TaxID=1470176 RepID=A0A221W663_9PSEU|nr:aldo/keto reductase [Actinoalloteichus hoggarensis]ASO21166.1 2,5-diketo-D-gluconic acid reductase B [Actinoalloteichus hoggarensis]MBB5921095.1 diketogulonate reductase-like aldo/keto reductase [Actinoalloteichus hoggarensis]
MTIPELTAASGASLPAVGFGTYRLNGAAGVDTITGAIRLGYRLIDSAVNYENEGAVGAAARRSGVPRDELVITSKLPGRHHAEEKAKAMIEESVLRTGLDHLDLYLIHWPNPREDRYVEAWGALVDARRRGLVRHIGVSNFLPEHVERLVAETGVKPVVNQIELHPYFPQQDALAYHHAQGIVTEAWTPLGRGNDLLDHPTITGIAEAHGASPAQVVLAWHVAVGAIPLPKAASPHRQRENLELDGIGLTEDEVRTITGLGRPDGRAADQDPAVYQEF